MGRHPAAIQVVDSHTEGEPTRVVVGGWPQPTGPSMTDRRDSMARDWDHLRRSVVCEPRGHDALVGALLTPPVEPGSDAGVVFFNNVGYLGMCGHGLIGVVKTLEHLAARGEAGRHSPASDLHRLLPVLSGIGPKRIDTPAGTVSARLEEDGSVTVENVPAFCHARDVTCDVPGLGRVSGDVAYGGNWFFLTALPGLPLETGRLEQLIGAASSIRRALAAAGITGSASAEIDHVELCAPPAREDADGRNFVLCPGGAYDRSPCGTGTSAKMAALHARGELAPGQVWRQESFTGGVFSGWLSEDPRGLIPHIRGRAFVTAEATLLFDTGDPFRDGLGVA